MAAREIKGRRDECKVSEAADGGVWGVCVCGGGRGVTGDGGVETIKPLLLESFVRQMSAGRPVLFKRPLFSFLLVSRRWGKEKKRKGRLSFEFSPHR